ncbi:alkaline ceramidase [Leptospira fluminis]|uniref:Neutral ceramidase n=1 Tax=Leptospira fluminis TaxID=2484979 RepID=A0A4R9GRU6_9LEPT|nr:neutral/alkaline non-lysosomal ceramidase N-terminal domain-containing protein [Leptospira fluminis]TGK20713.1 alkaline ceramidase [Leptospira fluminis]
MRKNKFELITILLSTLALFAGCNDKGKSEQASVLSAIGGSPKLDSTSASNQRMALTSATYAPDIFLVGAAKSDITGPFVQSSTGYNNPGSEMHGLAMRLYSRAFVIEKAGGDRVAIVTADMLHMYQSVKIGVIKKLQADGYGSVFKTENVLIAATHDHSAPSNISWYTLFNAFNGVMGFDKVHYAIVVNGITESIKNAYNNEKPAKIRVSAGTLANTIANRSSGAYNWNLDKANFSKNVDDTMTLLRFDGLDGSEIGLLNWFGVHGTSLGITNSRVHGDNKGFAAYEIERLKGGNFVAAFAQGTVGDISPNTPDPTDITKPFLRPNDLDPTLDTMENPIVHGRLQADKALELYGAGGTTLSGNIIYRHSHVLWNNKIPVNSAYIGQYSMPWDQTANATTCVATIGGGFLAGDVEGAPVAFAKQGDIRNNYVFQNGQWVRQNYNLTNLSGTAAFLGVLWPLAQTVLGTNQYQDCDQEKFTLLPVGEVDRFWFPNPQVPFVPVVLPLQVVAIGGVGILAAPFELSTMVGRRLRDRVSATLASVGVSTVLVASMANTYAQYLVTREEYSAQHFEGGFTVYGPWASAALQQEFDRITKNLVSGSTGDPGPNPPDLSNQQFIQTWLSQNGVVNDGGNFGSVLTDALANYNRAKDKVSVRFQGAHPRVVQDKKLDGTLGSYYDPDKYTYLEVQQKDPSGQWTRIADDGDPYTSLDWLRTGGDLSPTSEVTITWLIRNAVPGTYRIVYNGLAKQFWGIFWTYQKFTGISREFQVQ